MLRIFVLALSLIPLSVSALEIALPFKGRWFVVQGGDTVNVNHHMKLQSQWFGVDFAKVGGIEMRSLASVANPSKVEHFYSWNQPVLSPIDGEIIAVVRDLPDNALGIQDKDNPAGNHLIIKVSKAIFIVIAHFKSDSLAVKTGDRVTRHQILGRVGNSGNSDYPHIHLHLQNQPILYSGTGINPVFINFDVELNGKTFENVTWPLIRGLFISSP